MRTFEYKPCYITSNHVFQVSHHHCSSRKQVCVPINEYPLRPLHKQVCVPINEYPLTHGGKSKGTTCVVDRDVTAYLVVDRVLRFPTEQYGCRYGGCPGFNDVRVICLGIFCYFTFRICFYGIFLSCEKRRQAIVSQVLI